MIEAPKAPSGTPQPINRCTKMHPKLNPTQAYTMDYVSYAYSYLVSSPTPPPPHPFLSFFAPYVNTLNGLVSLSKLSDPDIDVYVVLGFFALFVFLYILEVRWDGMRSVGVRSEQ